MSMFRSFPFFRGVRAAGESDEWFNPSCTDGTLEVKGEADEGETLSFSLEVQGVVDTEDKENYQWTQICVINENDLSVVNEIDANGIYSFDALGKNIRVKINSISGGSLTVVGKFSD